MKTMSISPVLLVGLVVVIGGLVAVMASRYTENSTSDTVAVVSATLPPTPSLSPTAAPPADPNKDIDAQLNSFDAEIQGVMDTDFSEDGLSDSALGM